MLWMLLITAQRPYGSKAHDEDKVPAAGSVQNIAANLKMLNGGNGASQGQHPPAEFCDMFVTCTRFELNQNVVL